MRDRCRRRRALLAAAHQGSLAVVAVLALLCCPGGLPAADTAFSANTLRGVHRLQVAVDGVPGDFARYGLDAARLKQQVEARLIGAGIQVLDRQAAWQDPGAAQLRIRLDTHADAFAFYFYGVSLELLRKMPLGGGHDSFVSTTVWSQQQSGVLNPTDLPRVYTYVGHLMDAFIAEHGRQNPTGRTGRTR